MFVWGFFLVLISFKQDVFPFLFLPVAKNYCRDKIRRTSLLGRPFRHVFDACCNCITKKTWQRLKVCVNWRSACLLLANDAGLRTSMSIFILLQRWDSDAAFHTYWVGRSGNCLTDLNQNGQLVFTSSDSSNIRPRLRLQTDVWDVLALSRHLCPCTLVWMILLLLNSMKRISFFLYTYGQSMLAENSWEGTARIAQ